MTGSAPKQTTMKQWIFGPWMVTVGLDFGHWSIGPRVLVRHRWVNGSLSLGPAFLEVDWNPRP